MIRFALSLFLVLGLWLFSIGQAVDGEVKIKHAGLTLNADLTLAPGKKLADGVVLMTHGNLAFKRMEIMTMLKETLAERGLNTLTINLALGQDDRHGMYDCPTAHRHRDGDAMVEIARWIAWLKAEGAGPVTVLGHSRGANQTARYAAGNPDPLVKRAVLVAPGTWSPERPAKGYKWRYQKDLAPLLKKAKDMVAAGKGDALMKGVDFIYCPNTSVSTATFVDYYGGNPDRDTPSVLDRVTKTPVLLVTGSEDRINPHMAKKMEGRAGPNVRMVVIEDAGHFFLDLFNEDLADAIAAFVAENGA